MRVPCGRCRGCRYDKAKDWAIRCKHEALHHERNSFLTLTYDPDKRDRQNPFTLQPKHMKKFIQDLRNHCRPGKVRYLYCGEYGKDGPGHHPHYHMVLFGEDFYEDRVEAREVGNGLFKSETLQRLWPFGFSTIGDVTFDSAAYVAQYCTKKVSGAGAEKHYECIHPETGEILPLLPEYARMSRRPGIGEAFVKSNFSDVYDYDEVIVNEKPLLPPRYYDKVLEKEKPKWFRQVKRKRIEKMAYWAEAMEDERLEAREEIMKTRERLKRRVL